MLLIFEDEGWRNLVPLTHIRPTFEIRCGAFTLRERIAATLHAASSTETPTPLATMPGLPDTVPDVVHGLCRPYLMGCYGPPDGIMALLRESEPLFLINGRALALDWLPELLASPTGTVFEASGTLLAAHLSPALASVALYYLREQEATAALQELQRFTQVRSVEAAFYTYPWDLISLAGEQVVSDARLLASRLPAYAAPDSAITIRGDSRHVYVSPLARLDGPLVLDARDGPICIDDHAHIEPFSFVQGPAYIGTRTLISSALIRGETSIGPVCRIGGEVEASTIQSFSNKHHEGFLGHSWVGEWVNIGAMTTTSDLKNTYGNVKVSIEGLGQIDTGQIKIGSFLADHVKLGIGLHLTGGAVVGTGSNIFGIHMVPKNIPPFTWGSEVFYEYRIDNMISVAQRVMGRRKQVLTADYEHLLRAVFAMTRPSRDGLDNALRPVQGVLPDKENLALLARAEAEAVRAG